MVYELITVSYSFIITLQGLVLSSIQKNVSSGVKGFEPYTYLFFFQQPKYTLRYSFEEADKPLKEQKFLVR